MAAAILGGSASAQQSVTNVIAIEPYFVTWDYVSGIFRNCGYYLYGRFPAFLDYTSTSDYVLSATNVNGRPISPDWTVSNPKPGSNFVFGVGGSWSSGPNRPDKQCAQPYSLGLLSPWTATLIVPPPRMAFTFRESGLVPGRFHFTSGATDPKRKKLTLEWSFGDGATSGDATPAHDYEKPGDYDVTLKATNPVGAFNTLTRKVVVKAPAPSVSLRFVDREMTRPTLGEVIKVRATVSAGRSGLGALSNLKFDSANVLEVPEVFQVETAPPSTAIGTLQPGEFVEFDWTLKVVNAGQFILRTASVSGVNTAGNPVSAPGGRATGSVSGLNVEVTFLRPPMQLKKKPAQPGELSSDPGYEPATFPVRVKVSVPRGGKPMESVTLQGWDMSDAGLDIDQVRATGVPGQPFVLLLPQPVPFPLTVKEKPPQATVRNPRPGFPVLTDQDPPLEFDFLVEAEKPGTFAFAALFTAKQFGAEIGHQERGSNIQSVLGDLVLSVQVEVVNDPAKIKEGEAVEIAGRVKNLTTEETILLDPIQIINLGQGSVAGPVDNKSDLPPSGSLGIFNPILKPEAPDNESRFRARVQTVRIPGLDQRFSQSYTAVIIDFGVGGQVVGADGVLRELAPENILVEWGNGGLTFGGVTALYVPVEPNPLPTRELGFGEFVLNLQGLGFTRIVQGMGDAIELENIAQIIASYAQLPWTLSSFAVKTADKLEEEAFVAMVAAARYTWSVGDYFLAVNEGISAKTKSDEIDAIAAEIKAYYGRKYDSVEQVKPIVRRAWDSFFNTLVSLKRQSWDYDYGFNERTAEHLTGWLRPAAKFVTEEAAQDVALGLIWKRLIRSPKVADDVAESAQKRAAQGADEAEAATAAIARRGDAGDPRLVPAPADLRNLRGGTVLNAVQAIRGWAVDKVTDANLLKLTDFKHGGLPIVVAVRSRADETLEWMATKLGMTPKPVPIKVKNADLIDETFLGYRSGVGYGDSLGRGGGDRGSVILAEPLPPKVVEARLQGVTPEVREAVIERYRTRWEEWYGEGSLPADRNALPFDDTIRVGTSKAYELKLKASKRVAGDRTTSRTTLKGSLEVPKRGSVTDPRINLDVAGKTSEAFEPRELELRQVIDPPDGEHFKDANGFRREREYYEVWLEDEPVGGKGVLKRVSGDVDVVMAADISGYRFGLNPLKEKIKEYGNQVARILQHVMKAQHPWSSSLAPAKLRAKYLNDHLWHPTDLSRRGEPLLIYFNGERRVGWFDPTKEINPDNPVASLIFMDGGPTSVDDVVRAQVASRNDLPRPEDVAPKLVPTGFSAVRQALLDNDLVNNSTLLATCALTTGARNGAIYRLGQTRELEKRGEDGQWVPTSPGAECGPEGIVMVPETLLLSDVVAGALRLPILEQYLGENWRDLFRIGDDILIDPGTPEEEINTVANHGSLVLARPLKYAHPEGTLVMLLPPGTATLPKPAIWLRADRGVELTGVSVLTWKDQAGGNLFVNPEGGRDGLPEWLADSGLAMPAIRFKGDEWISGGILRPLTNATIFTLIRFNTPTSSSVDYLYSIGQTGQAGAVMSLARSTEDAYHWDGSTAHAPTQTSLPGSAWQVFTQVYGEELPTSHQLFLNGQRIINSRAAAPYNADASLMYLGNYQTGSYFFIGDMVEWILYDRVLPPAERLEVETYLKKRGGVYQPLLPVAAPVITEIEFGVNGNSTVRWTNGLPPFVVESTTNLSSGAWEPLGPATANYSGPIPASAQTLFFRIRSGGAVVPENEDTVPTFGNDGKPWLITRTGPTRIEAEDFDEGGEGITYHETTPQNIGGVYREEAVDIGATGDAGGGHAVGSIVAGEWLDYTIQVAEAGAYRLRARTARGSSGARTVRFVVDGVDKTGNLVVPATGNWESYTTVLSGTFELAAGQQVLRADMTSSAFNLNWIEIVPMNPIAQTPFGNNGHPWSIGSTTATRIEAENFDGGSPEVAYHDTDPANEGGGYRNEDVDLQPTTDADGGFNVSWIEPGEWLEYTIDVAASGTYQLRFRTARAPSGSSTLRVLVGGVDKTGNVTIPRTGGAQTWSTVTKAGVNLEAGTQRLRIEMVVGGFNLNWFEIAPWEQPSR